MHAAPEAPAPASDGCEKGRFRRLCKWASKVQKALDGIVPSFKPVLLCLTVVWFAGALSIGMRPRTLIEPIDMPKNLVDLGFTSAIAQQQLTAALKKILSDARGTMPSQIKDTIEADEPEANIELGSTGLSLQSVTQYTKRMLGVDDVYIRGALVPAANGSYVFHVTIADSASELADDSPLQIAPPISDGGLDLVWHRGYWVATSTTPDDLLDVIEKSAETIMKMRNEFLYASAVANRIRDKCYAQAGDCDYTQAIELFEDVLKDDKQQRYHKWSWLALSKIDEDLGNFDDEITKARLALREDPHLYWAYFNWSIGLAEQHCTKEALEALNRTLSMRPDLDFAYNAAAREALAAALDDQESAIEADRRGDDFGESRAWSNSLDRLREAASDALMATEISPAYMEAHINRGRVLAELSVQGTMPPDAQQEYNAALQPESTQVRRALASMREATPTETTSTDGTPGRPAWPIRPPRDSMLAAAPQDHERVDALVWPEFWRVRRAFDSIPALTPREIKRIHAGILPGEALERPEFASLMLTVPRRPEGTRAGILSRAAPERLLLASADPTPMETESAYSMLGRASWQVSREIVYTAAYESVADRSSVGAPDFIAAIKNWFRLPYVPIAHLSEPMQAVLRDLESPGAKCGNVDIARSIREANGCLSVREMSIEHMSDLTGINSHGSGARSQADEKMCRAKGVPPAPDSGPFMSVLPGY